MQKPHLTSMICKVSSHKWSEWKTHSKKCHKSRTCTRCNETESLAIDHTWGDWKPNKGKCEETQTCTHCGKTESRKLEHNWQVKWVGRDDNNCQQIETCLQCGLKNTINNFHVMGNLYESVNKCQKEKKCLNCGRVRVIAPIAHNWVTEIHKPPCGMVRRCSHCHMEEKYEEHDIKEWDLTPGKCEETCRCTKCGEKFTRTAHKFDDYREQNNMYHIRKCSRCGKEDATPQFHRWGETERQESFERANETKRCLDCGKIEITYYQWRDH